MHEGKRPGGLTALAVFNFIFGGLNAMNFLATIFLVVMVFALDLDSETESDDEKPACGAEADPCGEVDPCGEGAAPEEGQQKEPQDVREVIAEAWKQMPFGVGLLIALIFVYAVLSTLQIASGVGYLKQKKFLGRTVGNVYALTSIGATIFELSVQPEDVPGAGFSIMAILAVVYPVLTLILLNTTFKEDFVN